MKDIVLSFAGWQAPRSRVHGAIRRLRVGDALRYATDERGIRLEDASGTPVGRLSRHFRPPQGLQCREARVRAILVWRKTDSAPEYQARCRCESWEVVLPELVFAP